MPLPSDVFLEAALLSRAAYDDTPAAAAGRGWEPLGADTLGLAPQGARDSGAYSFADGIYVDRDGDNSAVAHVYVGTLGGERVLALAFRGTDEIPGDIREHASFISHYAHFGPLTDAIRSHVDDGGSGIDRVLVTGHSLGSAMVATAMVEEGWANDPRFLGVAFAAHGTDASVAATAPAPVTNLVNFVHTQDFLVLSSGPAGLPAATIADAVGVSSALGDRLGFEPKARIGTDIWIDTGNAAQLWSGGAFALLRDAVDAEHRIARYVDDVAVLTRADALDPAALLAAPGPRFFHIGTEGDDNIAQDQAVGPFSSRDIFPARDFDQTILALDGDDRIAGAGGNDVIDGGPGIDTAIFRGGAGEYTIATASGVTTVAHTAPSGPSDGTDTLIGVERLSFADRVLAPGQTQLASLPDGDGGSFLEGLLASAQVGLLAARDAIADAADHLQG